MDVRERYARALYAHWVGKDAEPNWPAFESGAVLNGWTLTADHFYDDADAILALSDVRSKAVALCLRNAPQECYMRNCNEQTCSGWKYYVEPINAVLLNNK